MSTDNLTNEEAIEFFSEFYRGQHHIPGKVKEFGYGWMVNHDRGDLATYDYNQLTRLVLMAHHYCYRVEIQPSSPRHLKIAIWKRKREGGMAARHPTIETAIEDFNKTIVLKTENKTD
jgi:hypothetical protein